MTTSRTTRLVTRVVSAVAVAALGVGLAACSAEPEPAAGAAASESASAPTSSPSPTELSPKEKAVEQAEKVLREFYRLDNLAMQAPKKFDPKKFEKVAIGSGLSYIQGIYAGVSYAGQHREGATRLDSVEALTVDLTNKPKRTPPEIPYVDFMVCVDISGMDTISKDGESMKPEGKERFVYRVGVVNYGYPDNGKWRIGYVEPKENKTC
jgi:hypothetical protein